MDESAKILPLQRLSPQRFETPASRHLVRTKADYYRLLQSVRTQDTWEEWILYMLTAVEETSVEAIAIIQAVKNALMETKRNIRAAYKFFYVGFRT